MVILTMLIGTAGLLLFALLYGKVFKEQNFFYAFNACIIISVGACVLAIANIMIWEGTPPDSLAKTANGLAAFNIFPLIVLLWTKAKHRLVE